MTSKFSKQDVSGYITIIDQLRKSYTKEKIREKTIINKVVKNIAISIGHQAVSLPLGVRLWVLYTLLIRGLLRFLSISNLISLISPFTQKFKEKRIKPLLKNVKIKS
ncbi:hypothetical protein DSECCO2_575240 [anaerobic digester metagenome]